MMRNTPGHCRLSPEPAQCDGWQPTRDASDIECPSKTVKLSEQRMRVREGKVLLPHSDKPAGLLGEVAGDA